MVHPLLALPACAVAFCALPMLRPSRLKMLRVQWWEWLILVVAAAVGGGGDRALRERFRGLSGALGLPAVAQGGAPCRRRGQALRRRDLGGGLLGLHELLARRCLGVCENAAAAALALRTGFGIAALFAHWTGKEMWYFPILLLGLLLILCAPVGKPAPGQRGQAWRFWRFRSPLSPCSPAGDLGNWPQAAWGLRLSRPAARSRARPPRICAPMTETTHDLLAHEDAKAVLVDPSLYYPYLGQHAAIDAASLYLESAQPAGEYPLRSCGSAEDGLSLPSRARSPPPCCRAMPAPPRRISAPPDAAM